MENFSGLPSSSTNTTPINAASSNQQHSSTSPPTHHINYVMPQPNFYNTPHYIHHPYYPIPNLQFPQGDHLYGNAAFPMANFPPNQYHLNAMPGLNQPAFLTNEHIMPNTLIQPPPPSSNNIPNSARSNRRNNRINSSGSSSSSSARTAANRAASRNVSTDNRDDPYTFCTPDNKRLRILVQKELSSSDVKPTGRIILPKRQAQRNMPNLSSNEGIHLVLRDVFSDRQWQMRFTFWSNYKGKMFVLDQTGEFLRENRLNVGDSLTIYEDESKNFYFSIRKIGNPAQQPSSSTPMDSNQTSMVPTEELTDEETSSLKILVDELKHTDDDESNNLTNLLPFSNPTNQHYTSR